MRDGRITRLLYTQPIQPATVVCQAADATNSGEQITRPTVHQLGGLRQTSQPVNSRLDVMLVEEWISLRAAEARRRAVIDLRKQAQHYIDTHWSAENAAGQSEQLSSSLSERRSKLQDSNGG
jgi:hypothetical protein